MFRYACLVCLSNIIIESGTINHIANTTCIYPHLTFNDTQMKELYDDLIELDMMVVYYFQKDEYSHMKTALQSIEHYNSILAILMVEIIQNRTREDVKQFADAIVNIGSPQFIRICPENDIPGLKFSPSLDNVNKFKCLYNETKTFFRLIKDKLRSEPLSFDG